MEAALTMLGAMAGLRDTTAPLATSEARQAIGWVGGHGSDLLIAALLALAWFAPNSQEIVDGLRGRDRPLSLRWQPSPAWAGCVAVMMLLSVSQMSKVSAFLYFQF
jgi:hypothetical protein